MHEELDPALLVTEESQMSLAVMKMKYFSASLHHFQVTQNYSEKPLKHFSLLELNSWQA